MKAWLRDLWAAARLRTDVFAGLSARPDAFLRGFVVIVAVALVAGAPAFVLDLVGGLRVTEAADLVAARSEVLAALESVMPVLEDMGLPAAERDELLAQITQGLDFGLRIGAETAALPTVLPQPLGAIFRAFGGWLARPFADSGFPLATAVLGTWLGYGVWVMLFAKLLGGSGTLHGFFGATALFALPHLLGVFARVPVLGAILGILAFVWGVAIYVKATAVSHGLSVERALLATVAPLLSLILLIALLLPLVTGAIVLFIGVAAGL